LNQLGTISSTLRISSIRPIKISNAQMRRSEFSLRWSAFTETRRRPNALQRSKRRSSMYCRKMRLKPKKHGLST
jgi:hypothetical protein